MNFQVTVFWVTTQCIDVVGFQLFEGPCWLAVHIHDDLNNSLP